MGGIMDEPASESTHATAKTTTVRTATHGPASGARRSDVSRIMLGWMVTAGFFGILFLLLRSYDIVSVKDALLIMLGTLAAKWGTVIDYDFGGSAGSAAKTDILANKP